MVATRYKVHRDKCCEKHPDQALVETASGTQLCCPLYDCDFHYKIAGNDRDGSLTEWVPYDSARRLKGVITREEVRTALSAGARERKVAERTQKRSPRR